jgi:sirohydrochlorin ferrochelatase
MRRVHGPLTLLLATLALAGCTTQQDTSADRFQGAERQVAEVVDDLAAASRSGDGDEICTQIVTAELAQDLAAGDECKDQVEQALSDANDYDLEVRDVTVSGSTARAEVRQGDDGRTATLEFERGRGGWRVTSLGA